MMRRMSIAFCLLVMWCTSSLAAPPFKLEQMQGAWWSDLNNTTADFAIDGDTVWLEFDSIYHPCRIEGDLLIFDLGPERSGQEPDHQSRRRSPGDGEPGDPRKNRSDSRDVMRGIEETLSVSSMFRAGDVRGT